MFPLVGLKISSIVLFTDWKRVYRERPSISPNRSGVVLGEAPPMSVSVKMVENVDFQVMIFYLVGPF